MNNNKVDGLTVLGTRQPFSGLEVFPAPSGYSGMVSFETDEFTSVCPVTGQPDFSYIRVQYTPNQKCIESKSFKLYLMTFRDLGIFCEQLAVDICREVMRVTSAFNVEVTVVQKPRGGIGLTAIHREFLHPTANEVQAVDSRILQIEPALS